jgi:hypothetical protein
MDVTTDGATVPLAEEENDDDQEEEDDPVWTVLVGS